ncbi:G-type lectin S-receptor-like serine/threonine-protein kinase SD1-1 isoform B [Glycine soja]|uniref:non-specific serine/threonine protein kinase n=1 Tax=Glycine soja TaxID=3848 RepID=A0A445KEK1_GLYSO|nr:G-type lectin S-receptor-like serine/threonine-protein kinase SD1-1 isoform B [Glycine soja]
MRQGRFHGTIECLIALFGIPDKSKTKESIERQLEDVDVPLFNLLTITIATNNFLLKNKIGQGGFGPVYKGKLEGGQEIAVKRLSSRSGQGLTEFITEVKLIAKLQHRNLVKLLGCCIKGKEKLLVYEYMVNGSLDSFIFDKIKSKLLDWPQRFHIILGIVRGLLYLHQDSRLRIIHRDLKASNILLDEKLNPKISDFGLARAFGGDQTEGNTDRVVGTYGYMAPEYAVDGQFSIKSDVFSFGILLLEIVCGNKNKALCHENQTLNLVGHAWTLWKEQNALQLFDSSIKDSCVISEVLRCIHVSLLCVQQYPEDRPTMTSVIQMLGSEMDMVEPKEPVSIAADTSSISQSQSLSFGRTIVSPNGVFELGFFNLGNPNKSYLGIWFKNIPSQNIVWVANGGNPINDSFALLSLNSSGHLVLTHNNTVVWSTSSLIETQNPVAKLLDSGNLVIRDENEVNQEAYLWQSFDYPSNTGLSGMKIGWYLKRNLSIHLTAWKSDDDPTPGDFTWGIILHPYPEIYLMKGTKKYYRVGPWNGSPGLINSIYYHEFVSDEEELSFTWNLKNASFLSKVVVNQTTQERPRYVWSETESWMLYSTRPEDYCDHYGVCGANAYCSSTASPICECLKGYTPKSPEKWKSMDRTQGCVLKHPLSCKYDGFAQVDGLKVPDTKRTHVDQTLDIEKCRSKCLNECSCMAYTNYNISGAGSGCIMWFGDLLDIKLYSVAESGRRLHIRLPPSELDKSKTKKSNDRQLQDVDVPLFDLLTITAATDNFLLNNKIGEGGFGPVYKGKLEGGQEIAVKRLSSRSGQGITEFITEVKLIAKLQHRNLVKLLGCCIKGQEELLVYEYVVNGSLNSFIFDQTKSKLLDWPRRFNIILGIARGLLYLHQDSRLRIIHRDLKASNVLLDEKLNPKISDFGMARAFGGDQTEGNTNRVVGTYGYMAPEYAFDGNFSIKSDVFSFGILLLEIVCGIKNKSLCHENQTLNLVGYAWALWKEQNALQLIDSGIKDSCVIPEVLRCIHVSLLCVQQYPEDRPTMTSVIQMLGSEMDMVEPKEPGFFPRRILKEGNLKEMTSNDELTISLFSGR